LAHFPKTQTDRIALQTHFSADVEPHVTLELNRYGYLGSATIGESLTNLCLVCRPQHAELFRQEAARRYGLSVDHHWQSITPLTRSPIVARRGNLLYVGDAGRVVEPLTGEGILYALRSGVLAAEAICAAAVKSTDASLIYAEQCQKVYRRRLWVNQIARLAVLHPGISNPLLRVLKWNSAPLKYLTSKVVAVVGR
jgi:flavin-dependent dehydrogenase